jgi:nucleoid DNA-binding protein
MKKEEIAKAVAKNAGKELRLTKPIIDKVLTEAINVVKMALRSGDEVMLRNFGTMKVRHMKERKISDIKTNKIRTIPARDRVVFIQSKHFDVNSLV